MTRDEYRMARPAIALATGFQAGLAESDHPTIEESPTHLASSARRHAIANPLQFDVLLEPDWTRIANIFSAMPMWNGDCNCYRTKTSEESRRAHLARSVFTTWITHSSFLGNRLASSSITNEGFRGRMDAAKVVEAGAPSLWWNLPSDATAAAAFRGGETAKSLRKRRAKKYATIRDRTGGQTAMRDMALSGLRWEGDIPTRLTARLDAGR